MSVEAIALVLHHSRATGTDKVVLLGIANHAGDGGAWPTVATLARYANTTERNVQRSIGKLVTAGELHVHKQAGGTADLHPWQRPNRYDVLVACPATCDHTAQHRPRRLPTAPADLWIEGVTPTSPGDAHVTGGVTPTSPGGVTPASPKPPVEPSVEHIHPTVVETVTQDARERELTSLTCTVCGLEGTECIRRAATSGHDFAPPRVRARQVLARAAEHYGHNDDEAAS